MNLVGLLGTKARTAVNSRQTTPTSRASQIAGALKPLLLPAPVLLCKPTPKRAAEEEAPLSAGVKLANSNSRLAILPHQLVKRRVSALESSR